MTSKEIKLQVQKLKAKAEAIVKESQERDRISKLPVIDRVRHFLDTVFTCADKLEIWLPYPENTDYMISSEGRVKSLKFNKEEILKPNETGEYLTVKLFHKCKGKTKRIHQLVAETYLIKPSDKHQVHHSNEDKWDNRLENISYVTPSENKSASRGNAASKYVGVSWVSKKACWKAQIYFDKKCKHIGYFETDIEAAIAYQEFLKENNIENRYATL